MSKKLSGVMRTGGPAVAILVTVAFALPACGGGKSKTIGESLKTNAEDELLKGYKPKPKKRPTGMPEPTAAELAAWDRKDPEGEKHLYKYDKKNLKKLVNYWQELECHREAVKVEGKKAFGVEPGSPEEEKWYQFKQIFIPKINSWQQRLLSNEPRIMEKSKMIGHFFEAHELVMNGYPVAYNNGDEAELEKADLHWLVVENKISKYIKNIADEELPKWDDSDPKKLKAHQDFCQKALNPPKNKGQRRKAKKRGGKRKAKSIEM